MAPETTSTLANSVVEDTPTWAPILFAGGAFLVVALVLILMWQKLRQSETWRNEEDPGPYLGENGGTFEANEPEEKDNDGDDHDRR